MKFRRELRVFPLTKRDVLHAVFLSLQYGRANGLNLTTAFQDRISEEFLNEFGIEVALYPKVLGLTEQFFMQKNFDSKLHFEAPSE